MLDTFKEIVNHTNFAKVKAIRVECETDGTVSVAGLVEDRSGYILATLKKAPTEFKGVFGVPNIPRLNQIISFEEYQEGAKVACDYNDKGNTIQLNFTNATGDFNNEYRLMSAEVVDSLIKKPTLKVKEWDVEFAPSAVVIDRLRRQGAIFDSDSFSVEKLGDKLVASFGDPSSSTGNFIICSGVTADVTKFSWNLNMFAGALTTVGDKKISISNKGAAKITVDNPAAKWEYIIAATNR